MAEVWCLFPAICEFVVVLSLFSIYPVRVIYSLIRVIKAIIIPPPLSEIRYKLVNSWWIPPFPCLYFPLENV